jgi:hypothetical protein
MTSSSNHVAPAANGQPKKKLVLNAFVEMCMLTSRRTTNEIPTSREPKTDDIQVPVTNLPASGNTPTIDPQTSIL